VLDWLDDARSRLRGTVDPGKERLRRGHSGASTCRASGGSVGWSREETGVEFRILGPLEVVEEGRSLVLAAGKQRGLLAILLLHANEVVSSDRLIEELWGGQPPVTAAKSLQIYVSQLRKLFANSGEGATGNGVLVTRPRGYELRVEEGQLDLDRFQRLLEQGRQALGREAAEDAAVKLREALALWRGPPLADFAYEPFAQAEIARLEELRLAALEERIDADLALGRHAALAGELEPLIAKHPLRERLRGQLMLVLYRSGRQAEALHLYQQTRTVLVEELGLEPGPALQELEQAILRQDPSLAPPAPAASTSYAERPQPAPSGTVTLLFSDIEGSTQLVRQLGADYEALLTTHNRLLRAAFEQAGGHLIDRQGDALFFAFGRAKDAVMGAAAAQHALAAEHWPTDAAVRVRIGIHTSEPGVGEEGYHGLGVVRASRICSAGHGGQILISQATRALIEDEELHGVGLRDLGTHHLKDMPRAERIFQLVVDGLPAEFPLLRAPAEAPPLPLAGREEELAEAARAAVGEAGRPARRLRVAARVSRHPRALIVGGALLLLAAASSGTAIALTRGSGAGGLAGVAPNSLGVIDPKTNQIVAQVPVGTQPADVVYGEGALWIANQGDSTISRVDPKQQRQVKTIPLGAEPGGLAARNHSIWVATEKGVKRIDPAYDDVAETVKVPKPTPSANSPFVNWPTDVAFTSGASWVISSGFAGYVSRGEPGMRHPFDTITIGDAPGAAVSDGRDLWVTDVFDYTVWRIDPTGALTGPIPVGRGPTAIAVGFGAVWVADSADDEVKRIDPTTNAVATTIPVGHNPTAIAVGAGAVWVANEGDGTVSRIDPRSNDVVQKIRIGGTPAGLAVASGSVWVTVQAKPPEAETALTPKGHRLEVDAPPDVMDGTDPATYATLSPIDSQREYATCANLLNYPDKPAPAGSRLQPEVAQAMPTVSADGKTYTFKIRNGFRFSPPSNQPVTATTFKYTIERTLNARMHSPASGYAGDIVGADAYSKGKAAHLSGVVARGNTLTIKLNDAAPDFLRRISMPFFCAVPTNTPMHPTQAQPIPSAGPYYLASASDQQQVLKRNPNYRGPRPHRLSEIVFTSAFMTRGYNHPKSISRALEGQTDYVPATSSTIPLELGARFGPQSPAARNGRQQLFINPALELDALVLNTSRPLFASARLRKAVNYAIDRRALAREGGFFAGAGPLTASPTDQYLPPGMPGFSDVSVYPLDGDLAKARQLAGNRRRTAILYTCDFAPCPQEAAIVKKNLAAIGIEVVIHAFPIEAMFKKQGDPGAPFDIGLLTGAASYPDPFDFLNGFDRGQNSSRFDEPKYNRQLEAAARLTGAHRYRAYARLDADLTRHAAPLAAFANDNWVDLFSARIGCQVYQPVYGMDLAALCIKR
jgi:YVTN family beta-propeller protein